MSDLTTTSAGLVGKRVARSPDSRLGRAGLRRRHPVLGRLQYRAWNGPTPRRSASPATRWSDNVYQEYRNTIHYSNRTGVRATCPDCHVPKEWTHKIIRKIQASNELWHTLLGTIDTPEKFNAKRLQLAQNEWARMKAHRLARMPQLPQLRVLRLRRAGPPLGAQHQDGFSEGKTCIDCHKGIAHQLPAVEQDIGADKGGAAPEVFHPDSEPKPAQN